MTCSDLFKVTTIQRQITWKWYNIQLYLKWPTNKKSCMIERRHFNDLERRLPPVSMSLRFLMLNISEMVRQYIQTQFQWNTNREYTRPTQQCHYEWPWVTWQNIQWNEASRGLSATAELLVLLVAHSWRRRRGGASQQAAACSHLNISAAKHTDC